MFLEYADSVFLSTLVLVFKDILKISSVNHDKSFNKHKMCCVCENIDDLEMS